MLLGAQALATSIHGGLHIDSYIGTMQSGLSCFAARFRCHQRAPTCLAEHIALARQAEYEHEKYGLLLELVSDTVEKRSTVKANLSRI